MRDRESILVTADRASRLADILIEQADGVIEQMIRSGHVVSIAPSVAAGPFAMFADPVGRMSVRAWDLAGRYGCTFGPFINRPARSEPSPQRRQRIARRVMRAHRK